MRMKGLKSVRNGVSFLSLVAENGQGQRVIAQEHAGAFGTALLMRDV
jgi:hypothetical protein